MSLKPFFQKAIEEEERRLAAAKMTRQQQFDHGYITVDDLDDEELRSGRCRDQFGKIPKVAGKTATIPRDLYDDMVQEHERRTTQRLREQLDTMVDVIVGVATDDTVEPRDRLEAAKYVFERLAGKTPERVQVAVSKMPWEEMMGGIAQISRAQSHAIRAGTIIDADIVPDVAEVVDAAPSINQCTAFLGAVCSDAQCPVHGAVNVHIHEAATEPSTASTGNGLGAESATGQPIPPNMVPVGPTTPWPDVHPTFMPAEPTPNAVAPANSSSTQLTHETGAPDTLTRHLQAPSDADALTQAIADQADLVARRKAAKQRIQNAKKARIVKRALGADAFKGQTITADIPESDEPAQVTFKLVPVDD